MHDRSRRFCTSFYGCQSKHALVHNGLRRSILSATYSTPALVLGKSTSPTAGQRKELDIERIKSE